MTVRLLAALVLAAVPASAATGGAPLTVTQTGYLLDSTDHALNASVTLKFRVFEQAGGGVLEWEGTCAGVAVTAGYYAVVLGDASCPGTGGAGDQVLDTSDLPMTSPRWLEVVVGGVVLEPRLVLSTAPTAALASRALEADKLSGHVAGDFALASHGHAAAQISGLATLATTGAWADVGNKPATFPPSTHGHAATEISGLPAALAGTTIPGALTVSGGLTATGGLVGSVRLTNASACSTGDAGTLRWTGSAVEICNGSSWGAITPGTGAWNAGANGLLYTTGAVALGASTANAAAALQVDSTTQGFLPPRMTSTQRFAIANPPEGLMIWDTTIKTVVVYKGSGWVTITGAGAGQGAWLKTTTSGQLSSGVNGPDSVFTASANVTKAYSTVVFARTLTTDFEIKATWAHQHIGMGFVYGSGVDYTHVNGYSADGQGPYFGALNTTGFPSGYAGTYAGLYSINGATTALYALRWSRVGTFVKAEYNAAGSEAGPWTLAASATVGAGVPVVIGIGEASSGEPSPLTLTSIVIH